VRNDNGNILGEIWLTLYTSGLFYFL